MSAIKGPKTHRPELVNTDTPVSQDEKMRQELGLGKDDNVESGEDEPASPGPIPKKKPASAKVAGGADSDAQVKELKAKNEELEKRLTTDDTRKNEQVSSNLPQHLRQPARVLGPPLLLQGFLQGTSPCLVRRNKITDLLAHQ